MILSLTSKGQCATERHEFILILQCTFFCPTLPIVCSARTSLQHHLSLGYSIKNLEAKWVSLDLGASSTDSDHTSSYFNNNILHSFTFIHLPSAYYNLVIILANADF